MKITKKYYFYAAHRNEKADVKCARLHGHTYHVTFELLFPDEGDIVMLFSDIDFVLEPIVKAFDHYLILHDEDPLYDLLQGAGEPFISVPWVTSAENLAKYFYREGKKRISAVASVSIQETQSAIVTYEEAISK